LPCHIEDRVHSSSKWRAEAVTAAAAAATTATAAETATAAGNSSRDGRRSPKELLNRRLSRTDRPRRTIYVPISSFVTSLSSAARVFRDWKVVYVWCKPVAKRVGKVRLGSICQKHSRNSAFSAPDQSRTQQHSQASSRSYPVWNYGVREKDDLYLSNWMFPGNAAAAAVAAARVPSDRALFEIVNLLPGHSQKQRQPEDIVD
jgi:hypothetical protein